MDSKKTSDICQAFFRVKHLIIFAEETDSTAKTFLQPSIELKAALDHLMRALGAESGLIKADNIAVFIEKEAEKTLGHLYRAFFDTADWLSINLRRRITDLLDGFSNQTINAVFPQYYSIIKPEFFKLEEEITAIRNGKGVGCDISKRFDEYTRIIDTLVEHTKTVAKHANLLREYQARDNKGKKLSVLYDFLKIAAAAIAGWMVRRFSE